MLLSIIRILSIAQQYPIKNIRYDSKENDSYVRSDSRHVCGVTNSTIPSLVIDG